MDTSSDDWDPSKPSDVKPRLGARYSNKAEWNRVEALAWICVREGAWLDEYFATCPAFNGIDLAIVLSNAAGESLKLRVEEAEATEALKSCFPDAYKADIFRRVRIQENWPGAPVGGNSSLNVKPQPSPRPSKQDLECWYQGRVKNWPTREVPPSLDQDWEDAKRDLSPSITRDRIRKLRAGCAPAPWKAKGRRPANKTGEK